VTRPTLIDALRRKAEADVEAVWQTARADAEKCRADGARAIEEERARAARDLSAAAADAARAATADAENKARQIRAASKAALADRLHRLAAEALPRFRNEAYAQRFAALARELPSRHWTRVVVNPADESLARQHFPQAEIVCDAAIVGGMDVEGEGMRVGNTLETRLEAAWPELLCEVMHDVVGEHSRV
jgi:vacuolar-type H+-ATPase subunit E/Vma4